MNYDVPFARDKLPGFVSNIASNATFNAMNKFERRISGKGAVKAGKRFTLFVLNEDMETLLKL